MNAFPAIMVPYKLSRTSKVVLIIIKLQYLFWNSAPNAPRGNTIMRSCNINWVFGRALCKPSFKKIGIQHTRYNFLKYLTPKSDMRGPFNCEGVGDYWRGFTFAPSARSIRQHCFLQHGWSFDLYQVNLVGLILVVVCMSINSMSTKCTHKKEEIGSEWCGLALKG